MDDNGEQRVDVETEDDGREVARPGVLLNRAVDLVAAYVMNHQVEQARLVPLVREVFEGLSDLRRAEVDEISVVQDGSVGPRPAVPVAESFNQDNIWCLECGEKLTMLKRHLKSQHNMTPAEYRAKWGLPADYPVVALNYSRDRSKAALASGLGKKKQPPKTRRSAGTRRRPTSE